MINKNILLIHPRRGLYRITTCGKCGHNFICSHCDAHLVTYRQSEVELSMVCHQCQSLYQYPIECPNCQSVEIISRSGGIEELSESLKSITNIEVLRFDQIKSQKEIEGAIKLKMPNNDLNSPIVAVTTRIYDPAIPYSVFSNIVFVQAENLLASPDYLVSEDIHKQLAELLESLSENTEVVFDTNTPQSPLFEKLLRLNTNRSNALTIGEWFTNQQTQELHNRENFQFPPYYNLLLITAQNKSKSIANSLIQEAYREIKKVSDSLIEIKITPPYPAKLLKRRGMFSYHTLLRFPRNYEQFSLLRHKIIDITERNHLQLRLNPRHLF